MIRALLRSRRSHALLAAGLLCAPSIASGQDVSPSMDGRCYSTDLPLDHWGIEVVKRLEALGDLQFQPATGTIQACVLEAALEQRVTAPASGAAQRLATHWQALFEAEYTPAAPDESWHFQPIRIGAQIEDSKGRAAPGFGEFAPDRSGAVEIIEEDRVSGDLTSAVRILPEVWVASRLRAGPTAVRVQQLESKVQLGPLSVGIGRGAAAFGYAARGSVVISSASQLDKIELSSAEPFSLPGFGRALGTLTFSTFIAQLTDPRHPSEPLFWGARGTLRPHSRVTFAINRAAMFGGDGSHITGKRLLSMAIGRVSGIGFENQIVSLEGRYRLPTESVLPVTAYFEWGAEDAAGAWWDVPGRIVGLYLPTVPGIPETSVALEYASFGESCCFNPEWYRHWSFPGSWALEDRPLGHQLGGHGKELLVRATSYASRYPIRLENDLFFRERGEENLFVPGRGGRSAGFSSRAEWRATSSLEIGAGVELEDGSDWLARSAQLGARYFY